MPLPVIPSAGVVLDGVTFNTDPNPYEHHNWKKRYSIHQAIGGKVIIQDFGTYAKDLVLKLGSGQAQFIDLTTVKALNTRWLIRGASYSFLDYLGNDFVVFISDFNPTIFRVDLYTYTMELQVLTINKLWSLTYTGS